MNLSHLSDTFSNGIFLGLIAIIPLYGAIKKIKVYEIFVDGARDGFQIAIKIIPYLVAMLVAIGMFRASGAMDLIAHALNPALTKIGMPADVLPFALIRPFSGSASYGIFADIIQHNGPNSYAAHLAGTIAGSTETTFYVLAVYFGSVAIKRARHAVLAGLFADFVGVVAALVVCRFVFG